MILPLPMLPRLLQLLLGGGSYSSYIVALVCMLGRSTAVTRTTVLAARGPFDVGSVLHIKSHIKIEMKRVVLLTMCLLLTVVHSDVYKCSCTTENKQSRENETRSVYTKRGGDHVEAWGGGEEQMAHRAKAGKGDLLRAAPGIRSEQEYFRSSRQGRGPGHAALRTPGVLLIWAAFLAYVLCSWWAKGF